jgi:hypothetical protein
MSNPWSHHLHHRSSVLLTNATAIPRRREPVVVPVTLGGEGAHAHSIRVLDDHDHEVPSQLWCDAGGQEGAGITEAKLIFLADVEGASRSYSVVWSASDWGAPHYTGIRRLPTQLPDGAVRLDTGAYELELCRGKGDGTAAGKWGIRDFAAKEQGLNLIGGCGNAIGGFYGPFFTPRNGLINPPEHVVADVHVDAEGPLYCRYRLTGRIPNGLDPALFDKDFEIVWEFFADTPWFIRTYHVTPFETIVDETPVKNKITVGDEYESGQGNVVFSRFGAFGGTRYRTGDPYAGILADEVYRLFNDPAWGESPGMKRFKEIVGDDINAVSWDYFWRLFCVKEGILGDEEIRPLVAAIIAKAHDVVHNGPRHSDIRHGNLVDVSAEPDQTIFPLDADKTVELNPATGYAMVWRTSNPVHRYQIVQRPASGWVNWGTNGENEYPELPVGSTIHTAYGRFTDWQQEALKMEKPLAAEWIS